MDKAMDSKTETERAGYETPAIKDYGDLAEITAGGATGTRADAIIQVGQIATFISS